MSKDGFRTAEDSDVGFDRTFLYALGTIKKACVEANATLERGHLEDLPTAEANAYISAERCSNHGC